MSDLADLPLLDQIEGAPHPRETALLHGQDSAQADFLRAFNTGRLHHGWLLTGPRGVGKATLAWRIARFLLATPDSDGDALFAPPPPTTLDIPETHPVARRIAAGADGGLLVIRRGHDDKGNPRKIIGVEDMRRLHGFFGLSATDGGRRVVIVDAADDMNPNAANALLKALEEPPARTTLLLVAHQPSRLLPTIRSRCRELRLAPLSGADFDAALAQTGVSGDSAALGALSGGSVGAAVELAHGGGAEIYGQLLALAQGMPRMDRLQAIAMADALGAKGAAARFDLFLTLFDLFMARLARTGVIGPPDPQAAPDEAAILSRLCPDGHAARAYADLAQALGARARHGRAVNLDPASLVLDMVVQLDTLARRHAKGT